MNVAADLIRRRTADARQAAATREESPAACGPTPTASQSTGLSERRSITSTLTPSSSSSFFAATSARCTTAPYEMTERSVPSFTTRALPKGIMKLGPGYGDLLQVCR